MSHGILLFAHGARDPQWAEPFLAIREAVRRAAPDQRVELAYLELMSPRLGECADRLLGEGVSELTIVPLFMAQGAHLKEDLPKLIQEIEARHAGVRIRLTPPIGEIPELVSAIAGWVTRVSAPSSI